MRVASQIVEKLLNLIQMQDLETGERLPAERQLCELLAVSRPSLREAIQQLNSIGVTESRTGAGTFVKDKRKALQLNASPTSGTSLSDQLLIETLTPLLDADPLYRLDVQEARVVLEGGTAWYAAQRATDEDIRKIRYYYDELAARQADGDTAQAAAADANFHLAIAEASHNVVLLQMMKNVFHLLQHNVVLARRKIYTKNYGFDTLHAQHLAVLEAISRHYPEAAKAAVCEHIDFVVQQVGQIDAFEARLQRASRLPVDPFLPIHSE